MLEPPKFEEFVMSFIFAIIFTQVFFTEIKGWIGILMTLLIYAILSIAFSARRQLTEISRIKGGF